MKLKKAIGKIHLWLGLSSGLVVFIVAITGCIYAFQSEIQDLTQSYRFVEPQQGPVLPPTQIWEKADKALPDKHLHAVLYPTPDRSAQAIYYSFEDHYYYFVYVNPYTGEVLKVKDEFADFFRLVLDGHFYLWLPPEIGQPVVASFTLVFLVMM
ncbi:MAG: PepSY-associated TM helix domain-containing protein, partial [Cyclobacteriaceae bacterium]